MTQFLYGSDDKTSIQLNVVSQGYVKFSGTAVDTSHYFTEQQVKPIGTQTRGPKIDLGTLGLKSNVSGECSLNFSSKNDFRLRHTNSHKHLSDFRLKYNGKNITSKKNREMTVPCNYNPKKIQFNTTGTFLAEVEPGMYSDTVRIEVVTQ